MNRYLLYILAMVAFVGCVADEEEYNTHLILRTYEEVASGEDFTPLAGCVAYAFDTTALVISDPDNDDEEYIPASYDDALAGILTNTVTGEQVMPITTAIPYVSSDESFGEAVSMQIGLQYVTLVVVDTKNEDYAYGEYSVGENLPTTYITLTFRPYKTSNFTQSIWTYVVPEPTIPEVDEDEDEE